MYLSDKKHILSQALINATIVQILATVANIIIRMCFRGGSKEPDMLNGKIWIGEYIVTNVSIVLTLLVFILAARRVKKYIDMVDKEDRKELGRLQEDKLGEGLSTLTAETIQKLLNLWTVIFVGVGMIQSIVYVMYRRFIKDLYALDKPEGHIKKKALRAIYNQTHGFKYLALMCALLIGVIVTAVILKNKWLEIISVIVALIFMTAFCALRISKFHIFGMNLRIVWTSVVFHLIQTVCMISFAIYLRVKYKGV